MSAPPLPVLVSICIAILLTFLVVLVRFAYELGRLNGSLTDREIVAQAVRAMVGAN